MATPRTYQPTDRIHTAQLIKAAAYIRELYRIADQTGALFLGDEIIFTDAASAEAFTQRLAELSL